MAKPVSRNSNRVGFHRVLLHRNKVKKDTNKVGFDVVLFEPLAQMIVKVNSTTKDQEQRKNYKNIHEFILVRF